ncbi:GMC oxidoreductase [Bdellovibrio sp. HCB209]|uniref:GMC oxidoreductase n=1 Tax=Bdellovibrio sp. HCB209 TaxID=3394354 RepID=UPI0039B494CE
MSKQIYQNIIVGSGPAAYATVNALLGQGQSFLILDGGLTLSSDRQQIVDRMSNQNPLNWSNKDIADIFPTAKTSKSGVENRNVFGSGYIYTQPENSLKIFNENSEACVSYARGGFSNIWGAAVLPFNKDDLRDWPINYEEMQDAYNRVVKYLHITGNNDQLQTEFPLQPPYGWKSPSMSLAAKNLREAVTLKHKNTGVLWGRARLAVDVFEGQHKCRECGTCLEGCVYGSIFSGGASWGAELVRDHYRGGIIVKSFVEHADCVEIVCQDINSNLQETFMAKRLFLAAGAIGSAAIVARSSKLQGKPLRLLDAQYFFLPGLVSKKRTHEKYQRRFTLADLFFEVKSHSALYWTHFQAYGFNHIFKQAIWQTIPKILQRSFVEKFLQERFVLFQGFMNSEYSAEMSMTVSDGSIHFKREKGMQIWKMYAAIFRLQRYLGFSCILFFFMSKAVKAARSYHIGGTFPMSKKQDGEYSDQWGRPMGLKKVFLMDASCFPTIPATTYALSVMAHADRVVNQLKNLSGDQL